MFPEDMTRVRRMSSKKVSKRITITPSLLRSGWSDVDTSDKQTNQSDYILLESNSKSGQHDLI